MAEEGVVKESKTWTRWGHFILHTITIEESGTTSDLASQLVADWVYLVTYTMDILLPVTDSTVLFTLAPIFVSLKHPHNALCHAEPTTA